MVPFRSTVTRSAPPLSLCGKFHPTPKVECWARHFAVALSLVICRICSKTSRASMLTPARHVTARKPTHNILSNPPLRLYAQHTTTSSSYKIRFIQASALSLTEIISGATLSPGSGMTIGVARESSLTATSEEGRLFHFPNTSSPPLSIESAKKSSVSEKSILEAKMST